MPVNYSNPPSGNKITKGVWKNPRDVEMRREESPNILHHLTMNKDDPHPPISPQLNIKHICFSNFTLQMVKGKNFIQNGCPQKELDL